MNETLHNLHVKDSVIVIPRFSVLIDYYDSSYLLLYFKATCPVCREPINCDVEELKSALPPKDLENAQNFEVTSDLRILQEKMKRLFCYQKSRGGIIDIEAEENKLLLITEANNEETPPTDTGEVTSLKYLSAGSK